MKRAYCYGMIAPSTVIILKEGELFPQANTYGEIGRVLPSVGGEAANSAVVLAKFGVECILDGTWINVNDESHVRGLLEPRGVDISQIYITPEGGPEEYVIADGISRTVFGNYAAFHSGSRQWNMPSEEEVKKADAVALDPYLRDGSQKGAEYCVKHHTPYVIQDCRHDSYMARNSAAVIISHECRGLDYKDEDIEEVFNRYLDSCTGLVVFTFGEKALWYGRKNGGKQYLTPCRIDPLDTTGAGDSFRGAVTYGVMQKWDDEHILRFASAVAAGVCMTIPHALNVPEYDKIIEIMESTWS